MRFAAAVGYCFFAFMILMIGCLEWRKYSQPESNQGSTNPKLEAKEKAEGEARVRQLIGAWVRTSGGSPLTMTFAKGGTLTLGDAEGIAEYQFDGETLGIRLPGSHVGYKVELISEAEMLVGEPSPFWSEGQFSVLKGRWKKQGSQVASKSKGGPLADASASLQKFEKKRTVLQESLKRASVDRDELVGKMRDVGVQKPADLKGNVRGQQLADSMPRLIAEIDGLERSIIATDKAILEAKALVRRIEREQAGISEEEIVKLSVQLREIEERMDGASRPVTPLDVEAALNKAIQGNSKPRP